MIAEAKAVAVINYLDEGCGVRSTARLLKVSKGTVARLLRMAGRHVERFHEQHIHGVVPGHWNLMSSGVLSYAASVW